VTDALAVLDAAGVERAHIVGISMGAFTALHVGIRHPRRAISLVVAGCGYGALPEAHESFRAEAEAVAGAFETQGAAAIAPTYATGPARVQFQNKDPRGWAEFAHMLAEHSSEGSALTMRGVQRERPMLHDLIPELRALDVPTLLVVGDEDEGCLDANLMLKRTIPTAGMVVLPRTGHTTNLEEAELFDRFAGDLFTMAEAGRWGPRDPRSIAADLTGIAASAGRPQSGRPAR
jgi:pimeloyl-ACP methyl ester carboxylesterase